RVLAEEEIAYTILAPWQAADPATDTRRLYQVALGGGRSIGVAFYDGTLSGAVSFDPGATADADAFIRDHLIPRFGLSQPSAPSQAGRRIAPRTAPDPIVVIATDGELYGHHQKFRDLFLQRLVGDDEVPGEGRRDRGFDVTMLSTVFAEAAGDGSALPATRI